MKRYWRFLRHITGYTLMIGLAFRPVLDQWTALYAALIILVFELPGIGRLYKLAKQWIGKNDRC